MVQVIGDVVHQAAPTSIGTADFIWAYDDAPKVAVVTIGFGTADGTVANTSSYSRGYTDGTNSYCVSSRSQHGLAASSNTDSVGRDDRVIYLINGTTNASVVEASFQQWLTNPGGIRLNFTTVGSAYLVTVKMFGGDGLSAVVGSGRSPASIGGATSITTSFSPTYVECMTRFGTLHNTFIADPVISTGYAISGTQRAMTWGDKDATSPTQSYAYRDDTVALRKITTAATGVGVSIGSFGIAGFTATTTDVAESVTFAYLAIGLQSGGSRFALYTYDTPTATGSADDLTAGWKPQLVEYTMTQLTATATLATTGPAGAVGWTAISANAQGSASIAFRDAVATTDTQSETNSTAVDFYFHAGTQSHAATFTSFQSTGVRLNWGTVDVTAKKWIGVALEQSILSGSVSAVSGSASLSNAGTEIIPGDLSAASSSSSASLDGTLIVPADISIVSGDSSTDIRGTTVIPGVLDAVADTSTLHMDAVSGEVDGELALTASDSVLSMSGTVIIPGVMALAAGSSKLFVNGNTGYIDAVIGMVARPARLAVKAGSNRTEYVSETAVYASGPDAVLYGSGPIGYLYGEGPQVVM